MPYAASREFSFSSAASFDHSTFRGAKKNTPREYAPFAPCYHARVARPRHTHTPCGRSFLTKHQSQFTGTATAITGRRGGETGRIDPNDVNNDDSGLLRGCPQSACFSGPMIWIERDARWPIGSGEATHNLSPNPLAPALTLTFAPPTTRFAALFCSTRTCP